MERDLQLEVENNMRNISYKKQKTQTHALRRLHTTEMKQDAKASQMNYDGMTSLHSETAKAVLRNFVDYIKKKVRDKT